MCHIFVLSYCTTRTSATYNFISKEFIFCLWSHWGPWVVKISNRTNSFCVSNRKNSPYLPESRFLHLLWPNSTHYECTYSCTYVCMYAHQMYLDKKILNWAMNFLPFLYYDDSCCSNGKEKCKYLNFWIYLDITWLKFLLFTNLPFPKSLL